MKAIVVKADDCGILNLRNARQQNWSVDNGSQSLFLDYILALLLLV